MIWSSFKFTETNCETIFCKIARVRSDGIVIDLNLNNCLVFVGSQLETNKKAMSIQVKIRSLFLVYLRIISIDYYLMVVGN